VIPPANGNWPKAATALDGAYKDEDGGLSVYNLSRWITTCGVQTLVIRHFIPRNASHFQLEILGSKDGLARDRESLLMKTTSGVYEFRPDIDHITTLRRRKPTRTVLKNLGYYVGEEKQRGRVSPGWHVWLLLTVLVIDGRILFGLKVGHDHHGPHPGKCYADFIVVFHPS